MSRIKDQLKSLRENMPKGVMWLLLIAAFIVVLILLTLIFTRSRKNTDENVVPDVSPIYLNIAPDSVDLSNIKVGTKKSEKIIISATAPIKVSKVRLMDDIKNLVTKETCTMISVAPEMPCTVTVEYKPTNAQSDKTIPLYIDWYGANETPDMMRQAIINITVGAYEPVKPAEPVFVPEVVYQPTPVIEPEPVKQEIKKAVEEIAPTIPVQQPSKQPAPVQQEACSDFAIPGYNTNGVQVGWIKPDAGTYYFHPFSDKKCNNPTGIYNPDTGIIMDIDKPGKKIGTDAEHIGYSPIINGTMPKLKSVSDSVPQVSQRSNRIVGGMGNLKGTFRGAGMNFIKNDSQKAKYLGSADKEAESVISSRPYDRTFILRQFKPIPATIVSEVRADPSIYGCGINKYGDPECTGGGIPVRATVDRNVYSDNGRTIILPTGTLLLGYLKGELPGPYKSIGRMQINWYQFIRPDGVEFNFASGQDPYSADAQGRVGVPGHGSTDYVEQIVMPLLTAMVPAAVNLIAPIADTFVNQIDLDNNTVVQSGTVRSSELAKNQVITAWNQVAQKLLVDALDNTVPPFSIAAGTRITVYSPVDLIVTCGGDEGKNCNITGYSDEKRRKWTDVYNQVSINYEDSSWVGQVRSFQVSNCCNTDGTVKADWQNNSACKDYDYRTLLFSCQANQYQAINNAKQDALYANQQSSSNSNSISSLSTKEYNEQVLGLKYNADGSIQNPFDKTSTDTTAKKQNVITCEDGTLPDTYGCCTGEIYTDMGDQGFNCCPSSGGDCFPPIK
ncbi:MAG: TrbI/VirB10 family protein [Alphaproteobacteria bacterium]